MGAAHSVETQRTKPKWTGLIICPSFHLSVWSHIYKACSYFPTSMNKKIISSSLTKANWIWLILWLATKHWRERLWNFLRTQCHSIRAMTLCEPLSTFSFYFLFSVHISQNTKCPKRYLKHLTSSVNGSEDAFEDLSLITTVFVLHLLPSSPFMS